MFQVSVRVENPSDSSRFFEEKFWIDDSALYTLVPEDRLREIGVTPSGARFHHLLGEAILTIPVLAESLTCPVLFAPPGSLYRLGATALANFGVQADLKPVDVIIGTVLASR